jgi:hypothetical protein
MKTLLINTRSLPNQPIFSCKDNIDQIAKSPNIPDYSILQLDSDSFETGIAFSLLRLQYGHPLVTLFWVVQGLVNIRFLGILNITWKSFCWILYQLYHIISPMVGWGEKLGHLPAFVVLALLQHIYHIPNPDLDVWFWSKSAVSMWLGSMNRQWHVG